MDGKMEALMTTPALSSPIVQTEKTNSLFENPYRLVSLLDLMKNAPIYEIVKTLRDVWMSSWLARVTRNDPSQVRFQVGELLKHLRNLETLCITLDLTVSTLHLREATTLIESLAPTYPVNQMKSYRERLHGP